MINTKPVRWTNWILQVIAWTLFIGAPVSNNWHNTEFWEPVMIFQYSSRSMLFIFYFYFIYSYLIPKVLAEKGAARFAVYSFLSSLLLFTLANLPFWIRGKTIFGELGFSTAFIVVIIQLYAGAAAWRLLVDFIQVRFREKKLESEKKNAELKFLRSQINPHFLFNTLNNINSLIRKNPGEAEKCVIKLSLMMRYMLKAGDRTSVTIQEEVEYLQSYLDLQKLRLPIHFELKTQIEIDDPQKKIEPLLLVSFIENCFKHGVHGEEDDFISISISLKDGKLMLMTSNRSAKDSDTREIESGIGLNNVRNRLQLCYPDKFKLSASEKVSIFTTELNIDL